MWPFETGFEGEVDLDELNAAKKRLTKAYHYIKYLREKNIALFSNPKEQEIIKQTFFDKAYQAEMGFPVIRTQDYFYNQDLNIVQKYIGQNAISLKDEIIEKRTKLIDEINAQYKTDDQVSELIKSIAIILCYRCGLPYMESLETRREHLSDFVESDEKYPAYLPLDESPKTNKDLLEYDMEEGLTSLFFIPKWHEWSAYVGKYDPFGSPYIDRFKVIEHISGSHLNKEALRRVIYQEHPITMVLHSVRKPFELADIVRESVYSERKKKIDKLINDIANQIVLANKELEDNFKINYDSRNPWHYKYNWAKYRPLLINASFRIHEGESVELKYFCEEIILPDMYESSNQAQFQNALFYGSILLALASIGTGSGMIIYTLAALDGIDFLASVNDLVKSFMNDPRQARAELLEKLDKELVAYENDNSPEAAIAAFLLSLFSISDYIPSGVSKNTKKAIAKAPEDLISPSIAKSHQPKITLAQPRLSQTPVPAKETQGITRKPRQAPKHQDVPMFETGHGVAIKAPEGSSRTIRQAAPQAELSHRAIEDNGLAKRFDDDPLLVTAPETRTTAYDLKAADKSPVAKPKTIAKKPKVLGFRYAVKTQADLDALKAVIPQKPANLNADEELLWQQYIDYYNKRLEEIQTQLNKGIAIGDAPRTWESYQSVMERYGKPGFSNLSQVDIDRMRDNVPQKPANLNAEEEEIWIEYLEYYYKQLDKIENELKSGISKSSVQQWEPYSELQKNRRRGDRHEARVETGRAELEEDGHKFGRQVVLSEQPNPGTSKGERTKVDQIIIDEETGVVTSVSNKSRQLLDLMNEFTPDEWGRIEKKIIKDVKEAYYKYSGNRYFQNPGFQHLTETNPVNIQEIILIYDYDPKLINRELAEFAKARADEQIIKLNKKHHTNVELIVTFQYE